MYGLVSAIVKPLGNSGRWRSMGIENIPLNILFKDFSRVIAILSNPVLDQPVSIDLELLRYQIGGSTQLFKDWLAGLGSTTLPTSNSIPKIETKYARFSDAIRSGYTIVPTHRTISADSDIPLVDKTDLLMTKTGLDYALFYKNALVNVNGFYHQTDHSTDGVFVTDGMKTCLKAKRNEVGILSFRDLGEITFIPITDAMIYTHRPEQKLKANCYIDTGVDLSNKTVMLVLGGYLHTLDHRCLFRISNSAFGIDFGRIPLIERYFESSDILDFSSLGVELAPTNPHQVSINSLFSDEVLRKYLQLSQTFFVVLDNQDVFTDSIAVRHSPFIGCYTAFVKPIYPLMVGHGRHEVFWPRKESDRYSININHAWEGTYNYKTTRPRLERSVSNAQLTSLGYRNTHAQFQLIGSDVYYS